jgi:hypothetical protein
MLLKQFVNAQQLWFPKKEPVNDQSHPVLKPVCSR